MIPRSFQVPNLFVDRLLPLLTSPEFVVLIYAARRTLGFGKRQDRISLRQFTSGLRTYDGRELDCGTGLHPAAVVAALKALHRYRILRQVPTKNRRPNDGTEYVILVEESGVDWVGLDWRRAQRATAAFRRTRAAQAARESIRGASSHEAGGATSHEAGGATSDEAGGATSDEAGGATSDETTKDSMETQSGNADGNQGGGGGAETGGSASSATGTARWNGCPHVARLLLRDMEISEEVIEELASCPKRSYWAIRWSTWWPSVKHRVANRESFLVRRVSGACRGVEEDQNPPGDWWSYLEKQRQEEKRRQRIEAKAAEREAASRLAASVPHGPAQPALPAPPDLSSVPEELRDLWAHFLESQLRSDREAWLQGAAPLRLETDAESGGSVLIVRAESRVAADWLKRRAAVLVSRAREGDPAFPAVRFFAENAGTAFSRL